MTRKAAQVGTFALIALIAWNAYLAVRHLKQGQKTTELILECSRIQANVSSVLRDLTDMETGQRGYLLTQNVSYLQPYVNAKGRVAGDFASLRSVLASRPHREQELESQLESLAHLKQAEMERSIDLRQHGYRHRAFMVVNSNEGMEYMDSARSLLSLLSASETSRFAQLTEQKNARLRKALVETIVSNLCLLAMTICLFACMRYYGQVLERQAIHNNREIAVRDFQLQKLTSALSNQARFKTSAIEENARLLLQNYGGFLPRQGHEYAEQIKEASAQMERLRQDLLGNAGSDNDEQVTYEQVA